MCGCIIRAAMNLERRKLKGKLGEIQRKGKEFFFYLQQNPHSQLAVAMERVPSDKVSNCGAIAKQLPCFHKAAPPLSQNSPSSISQQSSPPSLLAAPTLSHLHKAATPLSHFHLKPYVLPSDPQLSCPSLSKFVGGA